MPTISSCSLLRVCVCVCVCVFVPFQFLNQWTDFHEIWYERYSFQDTPTT